MTFGKNYGNLTWGFRGKVHRQ